MRFPKTISDEEGKNFWSNEDSFGATENHKVSPFYHKNYSIGMHSHEFYEINIVTSGKGCHYFENMSFPINTGDVLVIPPYVKHGYYNGGRLNVFHALISKQLINENYGTLSKTEGFSKLFEIEPYLREVYDKKMFLHLSPKEMIKLSDEIEDMLEICEKKYFDMLNIYVLRFLCGLCIKMEKYNGYLSDDGFEEDIIYVMQYIKENPGEKHSVKSLANIAEMTVPTFCRYFKRITNISPAKYVTQCRINLAKYMIEEGKYTKTEIAQLCGFYDLSHLDKILQTLL